MQPMTSPRTLVDKIWDRHLVQARAYGPSLLYIDRHIIHDGSFHAFEMLGKRGLPVARRRQTFGTPDHYVPTHGRSASDAPTQEIGRMVDLFESNVAAFGVPNFPLNDERQGIELVIGPEQGITLPGMVLVCGDSHTSTHGALGALAFGIGASENAHVLATQTLWQYRPKRMRIRVEGVRGAGVSAKDIILAIIAQIGAHGGSGHVLEFAGSTISALSVEERLTICNMSIEAGARAGLVAPDDTTLQYLLGRPFAPSGAEWDKAVAFWRALHSDDGVVFDRDVDVDASRITPMVTWGTSPEDGVSIEGTVPDPALAKDASRRARMQDALTYMGLTPGTPMQEIAVDRVFIGSCTNSRIEDLRAAAAILKGGTVRIPTLIAPGSGLVRAQAEAEGLGDIFRQAGADWRYAGCSMCVGMNGDLAGSGQRVASTSNRNFPGRQGQGARTHLMGPAMAAAAALSGRFSDVRQFLGGA